jgi:hypothetical protein
MWVPGSNHPVCKKALELAIAKYMLKNNKNPFRFLLMYFIKSNRKLCRSRQNFN